MGAKAELATDEAAEINRFLGDLRRELPPDWMTGGGDDQAGLGAVESESAAQRSEPPRPGRSGLSTSHPLRVVVRRGGVGMLSRIRHPGRAWAYVGALFAGALSIGGNVASVAIPPLDAPPDWVPSGWKLVFAAVIPLLVIIGFEIWHRVHWPKRYWFTRWVAMVAVIAAPAVVSFQHMYDLMIRFGESHTVATLVPVGIDGLMLMAVLALKAQAEADRASAEGGLAYGAA